MKHVLLMIIAMTLLVACNQDTQEQVELNVAAASGLLNLFTEIGDEFEEETGTKVIFSFGSSGQLADQIENGAPYDVFASANIDFINQLEEKEIVTSDMTNIFAVGRIGIATMADNSLQVTSIEDLVNPEFKKIAIANPEHAPYGQAAREVIENAGLWDQLENKLVYGRNISDTLSYLETGNAEVSIIALSLVHDELDFLLLDGDMHHPIKQVITMSNRPSNEEQAREFIEFLIGPERRTIIENNGFAFPEVN
ncbi:molybdate ABC transporter substrate-binding protein [Bacillus sp. FJAT-45350]|uniref:molybdate ABC transporter substrate-binding protein n=1 Tax=Bacillus sp. FJAT-45350 TaxID=2011014 RepID=UPI000BB997BD|nr:molybdate ABC transporter substrate-binding protein [Bacillus sp. FJAT-45350]